MREEQLSNHHCTIGLDLIEIQVKHLQICAFLQRFSQVLCSLRLDVVALQIETEQAGCLRDQICERLGTVVCDFVVAQVNIRNVNGVLLKRLAQDDESLVVDSICKIVFVVTKNGKVD